MRKLRLGQNSCKVTEPSEVKPGPQTACVSYLLCQRLRFCNPPFPTTCPKFTEEDSRAKEEEMLNDPCHMVANRPHRLPGCIVSQSTRNRVFSPHPLCPRGRVSLGSRGLNEQSDPPSATQPDGRTGVPPTQGCLPGLWPQTWLLSNLCYFFLSTDRGQEHRL